MPKDKRQQIVWDEAPPVSTFTKDVPIIRTHPTTPFQGVILDENLIGTWIHFFGGRSVPCLGGGCKPCASANLPRWYAYLTVWNPHTGKQAIAELPALSAAELRDQAKQFSGLRGLTLRLHRRPAKPNGRVVPTLSPGTIAAESLPTAAPIVPRLLRLWGYHGSPAAAGGILDDPTARRLAATMTTNGQPRT